MKYQYLVENHPELFVNPEGAPLPIITDPNVIAAWQAKYKDELTKESQPLELADIGILMSDRYVTFVRDLVKFPDRDIHGYDRLINTASLYGGQGVAVLPYFEGRVLLLYLFRHPTRQWHFEIPRGWGETNTPATENARKEVLEEVEGEIKDEPVDLGEIYVNTGFEANATRLFFAQLQEVGKPNENEGIKSIKWVSVRELEDMIREGEITDGFTISAFTRARLKGLI